MCLWTAFLVIGLGDGLLTFFISDDLLFPVEVVCFSAGLGAGGQLDAAGQALGMAVFGPRRRTLVVVAVCVVVALVSAVVPLTLLQKTEPAAMLKGE